MQFFWVLFYTSAVTQKMLFMHLLIDESSHTYHPNNYVHKETFNSCCDYIHNINLQKNHNFQRNVHFQIPSSLHNIFIYIIISIECCFFCNTTKQKVLNAMWAIIYHAIIIPQKAWRRHVPTVTFGNHHT